jgi:small GTP-binding protein
MSGEDQKKEFEKFFEKAFADQAPNFDEHVNVALVGKVSSGKSSLLNAFLGRTREDTIAPVGANSGVTTRVTPYKLDEKVLIVDCPGLDDVRTENSDATKDFLGSIDLGLFVVTGSADASQKENFEDLKKNSKKSIVILNKIDEWDDLEEEALDDVVSQWKIILGVDKIFKSCAKGFDPKTRQSAPMDIRGIDEIREEIFGFLKTEGKDILLARHLKDKEAYAVAIIAGALAASAGAAFIPGSAAYITATQVAAIMGLYYLYTGKILSKSHALGLLPTFVGRSLGTNIFLWVKSILPPTGVLDVAAAGIALVITFAMLGAVKSLLENGYSLDETDILKSNYDLFKNSGSQLTKIPLSDLADKQKLLILLKNMLSKKL